MSTCGARRLLACLLLAASLSLAVLLASSTCRVLQLEVDGLVVGGPALALGVGLAAFIAFALSERLATVYLLLGMMAFLLLTAAAIAAIIELALRYWGPAWPWRP